MARTGAGPAHCEQALRAVPAVQPNVAVIDIMLPDMDGVTLIERLRRDAPCSAIVALSLRDSTALRARTLAAGARAFVAKHEPSEDLLNAIRENALLRLGTGLCRSGARRRPT